MQPLTGKGQQVLRYVADTSQLRECGPGHHQRLWNLLPFITQTTSTTAFGFNTTRLTKAAHNGRRRGKAGTTEVVTQIYLHMPWGGRSTTGPVSSDWPIPASPLFGSVAGDRVAGTTRKSCM